MTTKDKIKIILEASKQARDSDHALFRAVIGTTQDIFKISFYDISYLQETKKLPSFESIRRCRQKMQQDHPELRGDAYNNRHGIAEEVRTSINSDPEEALKLI